LSISWMVTDEEIVQRFERQQNVRPNTAPPYLLDNLRNLTVCHTYLDLHGDIRLNTGVQVRQVCPCEYEKLSEVEKRTSWKNIFGRDWDISKAFETCHCCGLEVIPSGSRWSLFFCQDCKAIVMEFNNAVGKCIIPLGRHSMMNSVTGPLAPKNQTVDEIVNGINKMNSGINALSLHSRYILNKQLKRFEINESDSIIKLLQKTNTSNLIKLKVEAFNELVQFMREGKGPQVTYDFFHVLDHKPPESPEPQSNPMTGSETKENLIQLTSDKCQNDRSYLLFNSVAKHWFCLKCRGIYSPEYMKSKPTPEWHKACLVYVVIFIVFISFVLITGGRFSCS